MNIWLSSETLHASCVAIEGRAVLICGASGSGKSDLALRLIDRGFTLVSDDQTIVQKRGHRLLASAPQTIHGKLEIRGIGIVTLAAEAAPVALILSLGEAAERLPTPALRHLEGVALPWLALDVAAAAAPLRAEWALRLHGLRRG